MAGSMSERGLERRYSLEVFLRMAAYRAQHEGRLPPVNSNLWREYARLKSEGGHGNGLFGPRRRWFWRRPNPDEERCDAKPLHAFRLEKPFLTDDFSPESVNARLGPWPMVLAFAMVDRHPMGEWFVYAIEVLAEDLNQAVQIAECIFALPAMG